MRTVCETSSPNTDRSVLAGGRLWENIDFSFAKVDFKGRANMYIIFQGGGCKHPEEGRRPHGGMCLC